MHILRMEEFKEEMPDLLQILLAYLNCVTGTLSMDNPNIRYLIQNRYLID